MLRESTVNSPCRGLHSIMWAWNATVTEAKSTDSTRPPLDSPGATFVNAAGLFEWNDDVSELEK